VEKKKPGSLASFLTFSSFPFAFLCSLSRRDMLNPDRGIPCRRGQIAEACRVRRLAEEWRRVGAVRPSLRQHVRAPPWWLRPRLWPAVAN